MTASQFFGRTRGRLSINPPPVICARPCSIPARNLREQRLIILVRRGEALRLTTTASPAMSRRRLQPHLSRRGSSARANSRWCADRSKASPRMTSPGLIRAAIDHSRAIDHADDAARQIVFALAIHPGHLRRFAADQGAPASPAGFGKAAQDLVENARLQASPRRCNRERTAAARRARRCR